MEYIRSVKSNIKGGVDIELGSRTVLVGPNGSGKSSVVQAIQLAADGAVRDGEGRDRIKEYGALARFFPSDSKVLFSTLALSNDTQRHWEIKKSGTTWKAGRPEMDFEVFFPFEEAKSILAKGDKEIRAWLSDQILGKIDLDSLSTILPEEQAARITHLVRSEGCELDFNVLSAAAKKTATSLRRSATTKEKTVDQLTEGVSTPLTPAQKLALEERDAELGSALSNTHERKASDKVALLNRLDSARARLQVVETELTAPAAQESPDSISPGELALLQQLQQLLVMHVQHFGVDNCMVCRTKDIEENLSKQVAIVEEGLRSSADVRRKSQLEAQRSALQDEVKTLQEAYDNFVLVDVAPLREELNQIRNLIAGDIASRRAWDNVKAVNAEVAATRAQADSLVAAAGTLDKVGRKRLKEGLEAFTDELSHFCPAGVEVGVDLDAGRIGFVRDGQLHTGLSGGEWSALVMALGCYLARNNPSDSVNVLTPDDRGWDPATLGHVMAAVQDYGGQVIIMSTVTPDEWEEDWSVIHLGGEG